MQEGKGGERKQRRQGFFKPRCIKQSPWFVFFQFFQLVVTSDTFILFFFGHSVVVFLGCLGPFFYKDDPVLVKL